MMLVLFQFASSPVLATADGPDYYQVEGVATNSTLNMRASPSTKGAVIGAIPSDTDGISNFGCIGGLTLAEFEAATEEERVAARKTRWCMVGYDRIIGWAAGWYLVEGGSEDHFRAGRRLNNLAGSEWQVRDFAGETVSVEAWIAFKADGNASGDSGCNQFTGSYTQTGRSLTFGPMAATMMACTEPKTYVEQTLFRAFDATNKVVATQLLLALFDEDGTVLATLTRRDWD